jgi:methanol metabolism-related c-type cytochrome
MMGRLGAAAAALSLCALAGAAAGDTAAADDGAPTYQVKDGVLDWDTFAGYLRFNAECIECHGPDGVGSTFAPSLVDALRTLTYSQYLDVVTNGKKNVSASSDKVMPALGDNPNVMCFVDDIYAYLKGRADGAIGRGRPEHQPVTAAERADEDSCLGFGGPAGKPG